MDWNLLSAVAAWVGAIIAAGSAFLALLTYRAQVEAAAEMHVHQLFGGLMQANLTAGELHRSYRMNTLRLYTLEEVFDWVHEQRRDLKSLWRFLPSTKSCAEREAELDAWLETVASHLRADMRHRMGSEQAKCYGPAFVAFVAARAPEHDDPQGPEGEGG